MAYDEEARSGENFDPPDPETGYTDSGKEVIVATSVLTSEGQLTLPREVQNRLELREGDRVEFYFDEQGRVVLKRASEDPLGRLPGLLHDLAPERPVTIEEMDEAVHRRAYEKYGKPH